MFEIVIFIEFQISIIKHINNWYIPVILSQKLQSSRRRWWTFQNGPRSWNACSPPGPEGDLHRCFNWKNQGDDWDPWLRPPYGFVWKWLVPHWTQWFCWSLSLLNGYFIGNIPYFQTNPYDVLQSCSIDVFFFFRCSMVHPCSTLLFGMSSMTQHWLFRTFSERSKNA